ncbi:MAG: autotransporter domain-containing protein [Akkermansia sp.]|nr:autotransporter domain-containing protein [Akkermansia sp.]
MKKTLFLLAVCSCATVVAEEITIQGYYPDEMGVITDAVDSLNVHITGDDTETDSIYAGVKKTPDGGDAGAIYVRGDASITMEAGYVNGSLYGAGRVGGTDGNVTINMLGGVVKWGIQGSGGNNLQGDVSGYVTGDVVINVSGGEVNKATNYRGQIVGGGYMTHEDGDPTKHGAVQGNTSINITGGYINRMDITAGGWGAYVKGNASILFDASKNAVAVHHVAVYAQGAYTSWYNEEKKPADYARRPDFDACDGAIGGDSSITFIGDKLDFSGYISGDVEERVAGKDSLHFGNGETGFVGSIAANISNFSEVTVSDNSRLGIKAGTTAFRGEGWYDESDSDTMLHGMFYIDKLNIEAGSVLALEGEDTNLYGVKNSSISGTICGSGLWDDVVIKGAARGRGNSAPTVYVGNMDGSTTTMTWDSIELQDASVAFRVNSPDDYSQVKVVYDSYYATTSPHYTTGNVIRLSNTSLLLDLASGFDKSQLAGASFTLFLIDEGVGFGGENGEFSLSDLPELPAGLEWDGSRLYTEGILSVCAGMVVPQQVAISANWGAFKATRAFMGTLKGLRSGGNCTELEGRDHRTMVWSSVYAHDSRIGGNGADYSVYGGAVGAERELNKNSTVGVAFGYDWGKVNPFNSGKVDQETAHLALYGRAAAWCRKNKDSVTIDWAAAYGSTDSEYEGVANRWTQDSLLLETRATYFRQFNEQTTGNVFVGAEYFAMDSDSLGSTEIGSMQNLRLQVGVGMTRQATPRTTVFGEAALHYDVMRHNPYVALEGKRSRDEENPGRLGGSVSVGAEYQLSDDWVLWGTYSFDGASDNCEHNVNAGVQYSF